MIDFSKLIRELRLMIKQLPDWKFHLKWTVFFLFGLTSLIRGW